MVPVKYYPACINAFFFNKVKNIITIWICACLLYTSAINAINTAADRELPQIGASIGIALSPADGTTFRELFKHADEALYLSKQNGKNQYAFYHILT